MRSRSIAVALFGLAVAGALYVRKDNRANSPAPATPADPLHSDPALLLDRVWVDSKPEKYTDYMHAMFAVSYAPIGLFQKASAYQSNLELFEYKRRDARVVVHFPQTGTRREVSFKIHPCEDLPPYDLCLDLSENPWGGPRRYYALGDPGDEARVLGQLRHQLEHSLERALPAR